MVALQESKAAFISPVYAFYLPLFHANYSDEIMCNTISGIPMAGTPTKAGMFVRKGSFFKDIFNAKSQNQLLQSTIYNCLKYSIEWFLKMNLNLHRILHMIETGIRRRLVRHYKEQDTFICMESEVSTNKDPMEIKDVFTAIAILIMGFTMSGFIFLIEKLISHYFKSSSGRELGPLPELK